MEIILIYVSNYISSIIKWPSVICKSIFFKYNYLFIDVAELNAALLAPERLNENIKYLTS